MGRGTFQNLVGAGLKSASGRAWGGTPKKELVTRCPDSKIDKNTIIVIE